MKLGFTGTRWGMTDSQKAAFRRLAEELRPTEFRHGDCVGADSDAHDVIRQLFTPEECRIIIHPGPDGEFRALKEADQYLPAKTHFARNRDIVNAVDVLAATPFERERQERGGTWYTVGYGEKVGKTVVLMLPEEGERG